MRRAAVVVLDACGVGALPDADSYGDAGSNTLAHLADQVGGLRLPTLSRLGLGSIVPILGVAPEVGPAVYGRLRPLGPGKESTTGHWELMGVVPSAALPTYPNGFPPEVVRRLEDATGLRFCCNRPYSGTEVIEAFGEHHLRTGEAILYTSADSVLQIACHVDRVSEPALYEACEAAREVMTGEHAVGRVIARPFEGSPGAFRRREGRRDYAVTPPGRSYLEELQDAGVPVHGVGKIRDLFAGVGVDVKHAGATNLAGIAETTRAAARAGVRADLREPGRDRSGLWAPARCLRGSLDALIEIDARRWQLVDVAPRRRLADPDCRPRRRPDRAPHRSHARVRAAAGDVRRLRGAAPRRSVRRRGGIRVVVACRAGCARVAGRAVRVTTRSDGVGSAESPARCIFSPPSSPSVGCDMLSG